MTTDSGRVWPVLVPAVAMLVAANVLNNRIARRLAPVTSLATAGALVALGRRSGLAWSEMGFADGRRGAKIGGALAAAVAAVYAGGILPASTRRFFRDERALALSRARLLEEALVQVPLGTVLLEEVAFRGVLPAVLRRWHGPGVAVAGSSALFGLWHVLPALDMASANPALSGLARNDTTERPADAGTTAPPAGGGALRLVVASVISTGVAGVLFHELRRRGGLAAPSLLHLATNSLGYAAARAARRLDRRSPAEPGPAAQALGTTWKPSA
ncbi:CPBP family intramembrane glutamic endopeptidase [Sphaerisporangium perillae]|uniref:CPBP family intramembrane glutamic endopeptidase n=1 Tax=Sphaerisporangium perillae TaxID=2935860 RepID=UPI00200F07A7|nr:CPBP family intramembrane glutamic endopeptidase [Sphaerisporangium perillae]